MDVWSCELGDESTVMHPPAVAQGRVRAGHGVLAVIGRLHGAGARVFLHAKCKNIRSMLQMFVACSRPMGCGSSSRRRKLLMFCVSCKTPKEACYKIAGRVLSTVVRKEERIDRSWHCVLYFDGASVASPPPSLREPGAPPPRPGALG